MELKCANCGHEKVEWMPFTEINDKLYCGMCLSLGIMSLNHYDELKQKGFQIITGGGVPAKPCEEITGSTPEDQPTITEMKCRNCGQPPSKELPLYTLKGHGFCVACLLLAVKVLDEKLEKDAKIAKYLEKREN